MSVPGRFARELGLPPGHLNSDGQNLLVFGATRKFFIGVQPPCYEGDPMRLFSAKSASRTTASRLPPI